MHSFTIVAAVLSAIVAVEAGPQHIPMGNYARHAAVVRRTPAPVAAPVEAPSWSKSRRGLSRRCKPRPQAVQEAPKPATPSNNPPSNNNTPSNNPPSNGGGGGGGGGGGNNGAVINFNSNSCPVNPSAEPHDGGGPNGSEDFMNCGLHNGGWNPPNVKLSDLVYVKDLRWAIEQPGTPFGPCREYADIFQQVGDEVGVPAILIASLAMQESSCRPWVTGGAGEIGMMQVTPDKCLGDCYDARNNVGIGARYFKTVLDNHGGNVFQAAGEYNGWYTGMNPGDVIYRPCPQQQNLDYLLHMFNFWMQNRDPNGAGKERNKQACGGW